jgi:hypothetical protein
VHDAERRKAEGLLSLAEAAVELRVSPPVVRRLLASGILPGQQVVPHAPWSIQRSDLEIAEVREYARRVHRGQCGPRSANPEQLSI